MTIIYKKIWNIWQMIRYEEWKKCELPVGKDPCEYATNVFYNAHHTIEYLKCETTDFYRTATNDKPT